MKLTHCLTSISNVTFLKTSMVQFRLPVLYLFIYFTIRYPSTDTVAIPGSTSAVHKVTLLIKDTNRLLSDS